MAEKRYAPRHLGAGGRRLWAEVTGLGELGPAELRILEDACREADLVDEMEAEQKSQSKVAKGSMGQPVAAPLVQELRQHRATLSSLLRALDLGKAQSAAAIEAAVQARLAQERAQAEAQQRWRDRQARK